MSYLCYLCQFGHNGVKHVLTIRITWRVFYQRQEQLTLREYLGSSPVFDRVRGAHLFCFLCCVCLLVFVLYIVWPMLPGSLDCTLFIAPSSVSGLYIINCSFHCFWIVHYSLLLPFSLDCTLFIAPSIFSGLYIINCSFHFLWIVHY